MATITLELPEELAVRLDPLRDRLPELLSQLLDAASAEKKLTLSGTAMTHPVFLELIDFLSTRPTANQVLAHKVSSAVQERLEELLDKNREDGLTAAEEEEMDAYRLVNHVMILLKARARPVVPSSQSALP
jgi:DNA-binding LytR/AlgR family response regulator